MSRYKEYIGKNVVDASKERIHHIYDTHDTPIVLFSAGKDSQVVLHLAWEVAQERGLNFVNAVFQHDEFMMPPVVDFVRHYAAMPWVRMHHICIPKVATRYVFDRPVTYTQWDKNRPNMMQIPDYAIRPTAEDWGRQWLSEDVERYQCQFFIGKVAQMNGIRASESRYRWRASVNKLIESYITAPIADKASTLCKPIYDWEESDVFKYLYDNKLQYCKVYDWQHFANMDMRMSQPLHPDKIRHLKKLRVIDPVYYDKLLSIFPDQEMQDRYSDERDDQKTIEKYNKNGLAGVLQYIEEYYTDPDLKDLAMERLYQLQQLEKSDRNKAQNNYPIDYVLKYFIRGQVEKLLLPFRSGEKEWRNLV